VSELAPSRGDEATSFCRIITTWFITSLHFDETRCKLQTSSPAAGSLGKLCCQLARWRAPQKDAITVAESCSPGFDTHQNLSLRLLWQVEGLHSSPAGLAVAPDVRGASMTGAKAGKGVPQKRSRRAKHKVYNLTHSS
jgi:hypothetical protein